MAREDENRDFICINCKSRITPLTNGSYRNHCPVCLCSMHVDVRPGDRASDCRGLMRPVGLLYRRKKGWQIVHCCESCGIRAVNRIAAWTTQPDDIAALAELSAAIHAQTR